jgi:hypothetical protein
MRSGANSLENLGCDRRLRPSRAGPRSQPDSPSCKWRRGFPCLATALTAMGNLRRRPGRAKLWAAGHNRRTVPNPKPILLLREPTTPGSGRPIGDDIVGGPMNL